MNKKIRLIVCVFVLVILTLSLSGCKEAEEFDASGYVKSHLDMVFLGEYEEYITITNATEEEARSSYEEVIENNFNEITKEMILTEEEKTEFRELIVQLLKNVKYEVKEAEKVSDDQYTVEVTAQQVVSISEEGGIIDAYNEEFKTRTENGEFNEMETEAIRELMSKEILELFRDYVNNPEYKEEQSTTVSVVKDEENNTFTLSGEDFISVTNIIF